MRLEHGLDHRASPAHLHGRRLVHACDHNPVSRNSRVYQRRVHRHRQRRRRLALRRRVRCLLHTHELLVDEHTLVVLQLERQVGAAARAARRLFDAAALLQLVLLVEALAALEHGLPHLRQKLRHPHHHAAHRHNVPDVLRLEVPHRLRVRHVTQPHGDADVVLQRVLVQEQNSLPVRYVGLLLQDGHRFQRELVRGVVELRRALLRVRHVDLQLVRPAQEQLLHHVLVVAARPGPLAFVVPLGRPLLQEVLDPPPELVHLRVRTPELDHLLRGEQLGPVGALLHTEQATATTTAFRIECVDVKVVLARAATATATAKALIIPLLRCHTHLEGVRVAQRCHRLRSLHDHPRPSTAVLLSLRHRLGSPVLVAVVDGCVLVVVVGRHLRHRPRLGVLAATLPRAAGAAAGGRPPTHCCRFGVVAVTSNLTKPRQHGWPCLLWPGVNEVQIL
eukprot:Rhum_TRINITY_DN4815_c0_g1::Rhum_TRINITY_DN4815_c0_g1_i1::g.15804::m.15804